MAKAVLASLFAAILPCLAPTGARAQESLSPPGDLPFIGVWVGSRLQCKKDESGPVRCGMPTPFRVTFRADGTGTAEGENFPSTFTFVSAGEGKVTLTENGTARRWDLFSVEVADDFITFQNYFYPGGAPASGAEGEGEEYIHFIFDLARDTESPAP